MLLLREFSKERSLSFCMFCMFNTKPGAAFFPISMTGFFIAVTILSFATQLPTFGPWAFAINDAKSSFRPQHSLSYLGFIINSADCTLTLELQTITGLRCLLDYAAPGTVKDRQRIHGFATWVLFNSRWPLFLALDILRGEPSWLLAALSYMDISHPHWFNGALSS